MGGGISSIIGGVAGKIANASYYDRALQGSIDGTAILNANFHRIEEMIGSNPLEAGAYLERIFAPLKARNSVADISVGTSKMRQYFPHMKEGMAFADSLERILLQIQTAMKSTIIPFQRLLSGDTVLTVFAIDVSASMKAAMKNMRPESETVAESDRVDAVTEAIHSFQDKLAQLMHDNVKEGDEIPKVDIMAYGFGFVRDAEVRDLLFPFKSDSTSTTTPMEVLTERKEQYKGHITQMKNDMFGDTPMKQALEIIRERVRREVTTCKYSGVLLFIISDGDAGDCEPEDLITLAYHMKQEGFCIASCLITNSDLPNPKTLVGWKRSYPTWSFPAQTMFDLASVVPKQIDLEKYLIEPFGWSAEYNSRLFVHANQSENLGDFFNVVLYPLTCDKKKMPQ